MGRNDPSARRCNAGRPKGSGRTEDIIARNWARGTLAGGLLLAVSFGLMLVYGAVYF